MNIHQKMDQEVKDTLEFFDNLEDIEPSASFQNSIKQVMERDGREQGRGWPILKLSFSMAILLLFAVCNIWVLTSAFKNRETQISRNDMLDAIAEEYSLEVSTGILQID